MIIRMNIEYPRLKLFVLCLILKIKQLFLLWFAFFIQIFIHYHIRRHNYDYSLARVLQQKLVFFY